MTDSNPFDDRSKAFWLGVNGMEYISWENSQQIIEYDPYYHPYPSRIIYSLGKINSESDMYETLKRGVWFQIVQLDLIKNKHSLVTDKEEYNE